MMQEGHLINFLDPIAKVWGSSGVSFELTQKLKRKKTPSGVAKTKKKPKNLNVSLV